MKAYSWLFYGEDGTGKSYMLASAVRNQSTREDIRTGYIHDCEGKLAHLDLPDGVSHELRPDLKKPAKFVDSLRNWIASYRVQKVQGQVTPYDIIGLDSLTEYQLLYRVALGEDVHADNIKEDPEVLSQRSWGKMYDRFRYDIGYLRPVFTGAHLIMTAGAGAYDPQFNPTQDATIQPELQGKLRENIGHMFDMVVYVENIPAGESGYMGKKGGIVSELTFRYHFAKNGDFKIRNGLAEKGQSSLPPYLDGTPTKPLQFDDILSYITEK